ncbi:hypothetical protein [Pelotalea chapellei]|uniref:Uncharacterized protein n=1 Tax=Pelotalea chapellei TaxID=44671 RepID=A0ABS5U644_9BACT|nr:hypothetical protein [Pelotalea chapellei]
MNPFIVTLVSAVLTLSLISVYPSLASSPDLEELTGASQSTATTPQTSACVPFNNLNTSIRDGKIGRATAQAELKALLAEIREEYFRKGGKGVSAGSWVFPLAGYTSRAITGGQTKAILLEAMIFSAAIATVVILPLTSSSMTAIRTVWTIVPDSRCRCFL